MSNWNKILLMEWWKFSLTGCSASFSQSPLVPLPGGEQSLQPVPQLALGISPCGRIYTPQQRFPLSRQGPEPCHQFRRGMPCSHPSAWCWLSPTPTGTKEEQSLQPGTEPAPRISPHGGSPHLSGGFPHPRQSPPSPATGVQGEFSLPPLFTAQCWLSTMMEVLFPTCTCEGLAKPASGCTAGWEGGIPPLHQWQGLGDFSWGEGPPH